MHIIIFMSRFYVCALYICASSHEIKNSANAQVHLFVYLGIHESQAVPMPHAEM